MNLPIESIKLSNEALRELAEQLKPYLSDQSEPQKGDFVVNGEFYPPTINLKTLTKMWRKGQGNTQKLVEAFIQFGYPIGIKENGVWLIDTATAIDCMKPEIMARAKKKVREGLIK